MAEAAAHKRIVQLAYLVVVSSGGDNRVFDPIDSKRRNIEKECMKAGVGLILLSDYDAAVEIEIGLDANNSNIENRDINATIGRLFSEPKQKEIKKLIETSRLGELRKLLPRTE